MAVNITPLVATDLLPVDGVLLGDAKAQIKKIDRRDLLVITLAPAATIAGVFTQNRFCAAPVQVAKEHLAIAKQTGKHIRALVINTGNANAGTGQAGVDAARATCDALAELLSCDAAQILPFSTGVILEPLPLERVVKGLPEAVLNLAPDNWFNAAHAIMTTDTCAKALSQQVVIDGEMITMTGISKGSGMIHPNMATMLGFMAIDASISEPVLAHLVKQAANQSFNCITVDGDTSTNDAFMLIATGARALEINSIDSAKYHALEKAVISHAQSLAQMIVRDGEGATKLMTISVLEGRSEEECRKVAYAIAHSPLVKTAFFASDPNLGRILAAIGYAGVDDLDVNKIELYLDDVLVANNGGRCPTYQEEDGQRIMQQSEILIKVILARGEANATIWTCDLSHEYVSINADYRS